MSNPETAKEEVEAFAALVGTTQAELRKVDEQIVGESGNLKRDNFAGQNILQTHINTVAGSVDGGPPPPSPAAPPPPSTHVPPTPHSPPAPQPVMGHAPPSAQYGTELTLVLQKLVEIDQELKRLNTKLDDVEYFDKKVIDSLTKGLNNKVKQVTIKLDDVKRS